MIQHHLKDLKFKYNILTGSFSGLPKRAISNQPDDATEMKALLRKLSDEELEKIKFCANVGKSFLKVAKELPTDLLTKNCFGHKVSYNVISTEVIAYSHQGGCNVSAPFPFLKEDSGATPPTFTINFRSREYPITPSEEEVNTYLNDFKAKMEKFGEDADKLCTKEAQVDDVLKEITSKNIDDTLRENRIKESPSKKVVPEKSIEGDDA